MYVWKIKMASNCRTNKKFWNTVSSTSVKSLTSSIPENLPSAGPVPHILLEEVTKVTLDMKKSKALGPDDLLADIWELEELIVKAANWLKKIIQCHCGLWTRVCWLGHNIIVPDFKNKCDLVDCYNYPPILLLSHTMKIFDQIPDQHLCNIMRISINQCSFVKGSSTTETIFAAHMLIEEHWEKGKRLHSAFLDIEKPLTMFYIS